MHKPAVFLDSSVIISALLSAKGGSFYIISQLHSRYSLHINEYVFAEVQEVLKTKFMTQTQLQDTLLLLLGLAKVKTLANPTKKELKTASRLISKEDAPILACAMVHCDFLITLDKEFLKPIVIEAGQKKGLRILTPGDFVVLNR